MVLVPVLLCACQNNALAAPSVVTPALTLPFTQTVIPTATPELLTTATQENQTQPIDLGIQSAWEKSPHADQVEVTSPATGAKSQIVNCNDCHEGKGGGIAWFDHTTQQYQSVPDINSLCQKCHNDLNPSNHQVVGDLAHKNFQCIDCHDPHSTVASCSNSACHNGILQLNDVPPATPTWGHPKVESPFCGGASCHPAATAAASMPHSVHGSVHSSVTCEACHDAAGLPVNPEDSNGQWVTWQAVVQSGSSVKVPYFSHRIAVKVDCNRCHFSDNPWNLLSVSGNEFAK